MKSVSWLCFRAKTSWNERTPKQHGMILWFCYVINVPDRTNTHSHSHSHLQMLKHAEHQSCSFHSHLLTCSLATLNLFVFVFVSAFRVLLGARVSSLCSCVRCCCCCCCCHNKVARVIYCKRIGEWIHVILYLTGQINRIYYRRHQFVFTSWLIRSAFLSSSLCVDISALLP